MRAGRCSARGGWVLAALAEQACMAVGCRSCWKLLLRVPTLIFVCYTHACRQAANCQPNFRRGVTPNPSQSCGPYKPILQWQQQTSTDVEATAATARERLAGSSNGQASQLRQRQHQVWPSEHAHDTIAMVVVAGGSVAAAASSNGAIHKVPGRVGDASLPGGGAYADSEVGGCGATGGLALCLIAQVARSLAACMAERCLRHVPNHWQF
jgi:hypothetical protein